jgi:hypothetical protein
MIVRFSALGIFLTDVDCVFIFFSIRLELDCILEHIILIRGGPFSTALGTTRAPVSPDEMP